MKNSPFEPPGDMRELGKNVHNMFLGLVDGGFTEDQAIKLIGILLANISTSKDGDDDS